MPLRNFQVKILNELKHQLRQGFKKILIQSPTGSGKSYLMKAIASKNNNHIILTHRQEILHSFLPSNVEMIETFYNKYKKDNSILNKYSLFLIDEVHRAEFDKLVSKIENKIVLGFSATPIRSGSQKSLSTIWQCLIHGPTAQTLIKEGNLVPTVNYCPNKNNLETIKKKGNDFDADSVSQNFTQNKIYKGVVTNYKNICPNTKTIVFASNIKSTIEIYNEFKNNYLPVKYVDSTFNEADRERIFNWFKNSKNGILCNCSIATTGFDCPDIQTVILYRATTSYPLYCVDEHTEILTKKGWTKNVSSDDIIATFDMETEQIEYSKPEYIHQHRELTEDEYFISFKGQSMDWRVTDQHRMIYSPVKTSIKWRMATAEEIFNKKSGVKIPVAGFNINKGIPLSNDEIRFIAWFLTDGCLSKHTNAIIISQSEHQPWNTNIVSMLEGCNFKYSVYKFNRNTQYKATSRGVHYVISKGKPRGTFKDKTGWAKLEPYIDKDLSPLLMSMNTDQFDIFLESIHQGDGNKQLGQKWTRRSYHITTGNKNFADRLQILALQNGYKANISQFHYNISPIYIIHLKKQNWQQVGSSYDSRPTFQKDFKDRATKVWCVTTPKGTIVTRRNGKVTIMGNCQMIGRGTRSHPNKTHCNVLDFGNNVKRLGFWESPITWSLDKKTTTSKKKQKSLTKTCPNIECNKENAQESTHCNYCNTAFKITTIKKEQEFTTLEKISKKDIQIRDVKKYPKQIGYYIRLAKSKDDVLRIIKEFGYNPSYYFFVKKFYQKVLSFEL